MTRQLIWNTSLILLIGITMLLTAVPMTHAEAGDGVPVYWQAAQDIRDLGFAAQRELYAAERAADPAQNLEAAVALLQEAAMLYEAILGPELSILAPHADEIAQTALDAAQTAAQNGDSVTLSLARGQLWTALLQGSFDATLALLEQGDIDGAEAWLRIREFRTATRVTTVENLASRALVAYKLGQTDAALTMSAVADDLHDVYFYQLRQALDELDQAAEKEFASRAANWVGSVEGYFAIIRGDFAQKQGENAALAVDTLIADLKDAALIQNWEILSLTLAAFQDAIAAYQPVEFTPEEINNRAHLLYVFTNLINVEYRDAVRDGVIVIPVEYSEALTFHDQSKTLFEDLRPIMARRNVTSADRMNDILTEIDAIMTVKGDKIRVESLVNEALFLIDSSFSIRPAGDDTTAVFNEIDTMLDEVIALVEAGEYRKAEDKRLAAYATWDIGPELRLLGVDPELVARVDGLFWQGYDGQEGLAANIASRSSVDEIRATRTRLDDALNLAFVKINDGPSAAGAVIANTAVIVFREGLEAVVILAALMASMKSSKQQKYRKPMAWGAGAAFIASIGTWAIAHAVLDSFSQYGERLEAVVSIIAIFVLLLITNWFFHKIYWTGWMARFHRAKGSTIRRNNGQFIGLALLGFTSIYREGFETVLFLQALVLDAGLLVVIQGVIVGLAAVAVVGFITFKLQTRLPYKSMLILTGVLITGVLVTMVGHTVHTMQAVGWVSISPIRDVYIPYWMGLWLGVYATWQTLLGQVFAAVFVVGSYYLAEVFRRRKSHRPKQATQPSATVVQRDVAHGV